jgi:hypothetical protein
VSKLRVSSFAISIDGYGAGRNQDLQNPIGAGGTALMEWFFPTRTWQHMHGHEGGETGIDDRIAAEGLSGIGAWILGRNMLGATLSIAPARRASRLGLRPDRRLRTRHPPVPSFYWIGMAGASLAGFLAAWPVNYVVRRGVAHHH